MSGGNIDTSKAGAPGSWPRSRNATATTTTSDSSAITGSIRRSVMATTIYAAGTAFAASLPRGDSGRSFAQRNAETMTLLILRALGLGDLLTAVPALRALADAFPEHRRILAAPAPLAELAMLTGTIDEVVPAAPLAPLDPSLARPDVAVNLHGRGPQSHRVLLDVAPERLIAFRHPDVPETAGAPEWRADEHEVRRWCRLLQDSGIPADPARLDLAPPGFSPPAAAPDHAWGATLIHPGAASGARRWPAERWAAVARAETAAGRRVIVTGGVEETPLARTVARLAGLRDDAVYAGRT